MNAVHWSEIDGACLGVASAGLYGERADVALLVAPGSAAAVTTRSTAAASSCLWTRGKTPGAIHAVVVNAGNANAATGPKGMSDTRAMAEAAANALGCPTDSILVCSTGVIGVPLPIEQVREAIREAASNLNGSTIEAARAIMTTDTVEKMAGAACEQFRVAGFAKGSGMVHPNMGTMLAFLVTDAAIAPHDLQTCLERVTERTFNCVTVDGDTSTNDTVILQATGRGAFLKDDGLERFEALLGETCQTLAKAIARDGEGASRLLEVRVKGCACDSEARDAARAVARSPLVKTAVYGCDPNWGRIVAALGAEGVPGLDDVSVDVAGMSLVSGGAPLPFDEKLASQAMRVQEVAIEIALPGPGAGVAWGCDLTGEYVRINAEYRS